MKRKIQCIYIDGMEKTGKTSITREVRMFLKSENKDLHEIDGTDPGKLEIQRVLLEDNKDAVILKQNSILSVFYKDFKEGRGIPYIEKSYKDLIREERSLNHDYGAVHFFLIPNDLSIMVDRYDPEELPSYMGRLVDFYANINLYTATHGLDIRLIFFNEHDRIYDVRDKILASLEENYNI